MINEPCIHVLTEIDAIHASNLHKTASLHYSRMMQQEDYLCGLIDQHKRTWGSEMSNIYEIRYNACEQARVVVQYRCTTSALSPITHVGKPWLLLVLHFEPCCVFISINDRSAATAVSRSRIRMPIMHGTSLTQRAHAQEAIRRCKLLLFLGGIDPFHPIAFY